MQIAHIEDWAAAYVESTALAYKLAPPPPPATFGSGPGEARRIAAPGRPGELDLVSRAGRSATRAQLANPRRRAQLVHAFWHHELQAAELMCWAMLAFPDTPEPFRRGLLGICLDEIRHMGLYRDHLQRLGFALGDFPVRDWFWQRVPHCETPLQFVALMGIGLEGGNLDHTQRFEQWFDEVGDRHGAELQRIVGDEEVAHVRFAMKWFAAWSDGVAFDGWREQLIAPLTPTMMKGASLDTARRRQAGFSDDFLAALREWHRP
ncbi:MAG: DUF455 family protein [Planctomycetota bacterium]